MSSTQHTEGRLSAAHWHDDEAELEGWTLVADKHRLPLCSADCEDPSEAEQNARRLVACWNALESFHSGAVADPGFKRRLEGALRFCDALTIEQIEGKDPTVGIPVGLGFHDRMQQLVDALAATETYLAERVSAKAGSTGATKILPMIRAALEGATVAPTPTSWGDC